MKVVSGKDLSKVLEKHGWELKRITGSHHIFARKGSLVRLSVPIHGNQPLKLGLLKHILKLADLTEADL